MKRKRDVCRDVSMDVSMDLAPGLRGLLDRMAGLGFSPYLVGGFVRDRVLGLEAKDVDLVMVGDLKDLRDLAAGLSLGDEALGPYGTLSIPYEGARAQLALSRREGPYGDGRHPKSLSFGAPLREDAFRRDFLQNTLLYDPRQERVIDYMGALDSLRADRVMVETVVEADLSLSRDRLRLVRAFRLYGRISQARKVCFSPELRAAMAKEKESLADLEAAVLHREVFKIWQEEKLGPVLKVMADLGVLTKIYPGLGGASLRPDWTALVDRQGGPLARMGLLAYLAGRHPARLYGPHYPRKLKKRLGRLHRLLGLLSSDGKGKEERRLAKRQLALYPRGDLDLACQILKDLTLAKDSIYDRICRRGEIVYGTDLALDSHTLLEAGYQGPALGQAQAFLLDCVYEEEALNQPHTLYKLLEKRGI